MIDSDQITEELIKQSFPNYLDKVIKEYYFFDDWDVFHSASDMFEHMYESFKDDPIYCADATFTTQAWEVDNLNDAVIVHTFWNESGDEFLPENSYQNHRFYAFVNQDHLDRFIRCNPDSHFEITQIQ